MFILFNIKKGFKTGAPRLNIQSVKSAGGVVGVAALLYRRGYCGRVLAGDAAARWRACYREARRGRLPCDLSNGAKWTLAPFPERVAARVGVAAWRVARRYCGRSVAEIIGQRPY